MERDAENAHTNNPKHDDPIYELTGDRQWLEVRCTKCGRLAHGDQDETKEADEIQKKHAEKFRGHRVNVEMFFRTAVSTKLNDAPAELDDECKGHPAGPEDAMGETVFCDGSCRRAAALDTRD